MSMENDKNFIVVKDGQRMPGAMTESDANKTADTLRKKLVESAPDSQKAPVVEVKQNLMG